MSIGVVVDLVTMAALLCMDVYIAFWPFATIAHRFYHMVMDPEELGVDDVLAIFMVGLIVIVLIVFLLACMVAVGRVLHGLTLQELLTSTHL